MKTQNSIQNFFSGERLQKESSAFLIRELLDYRAVKKDKEVRSNLLKTLVLQYSLAERKLTELNQLKNKFLGMAAHDLRNPLASIRGLSEILLEELESLSDDQKELLVSINTTSDQMLGMVNDLLDISVIESGKIELALKKTPLRKLLEERIKINSVMAEKKGITLSAEFADVPDIPLDESRLIQVIDNLISNAMKFSPPSSTVYIALVHEGQTVKVSVRDEGPGLSEEDKSKLFGEFQKLSARPTGGEKSTGLGLSIVKKIVEAHNGNIWEEGTQGSGALFCFTLPLEANHG